MAQVEGSGTGLPLSEKAALNAPAPTMSVPTRSQSGSSASSRVQLCRSAKPAGNEAPSGTMGFGAESQRKSPSFYWTCGTKKY